MQRSLPSSDLNGLSYTDASREAVAPRYGAKGGTWGDIPRPSKVVPRIFTVLGQEMSPRTVFCSMPWRASSRTRGIPRRRDLNDMKGTA